MLLGLLTLITALSISAVAIYYSVAGLMTIFAAAALPIMIMGGVLEIGKLVTAVWLHKYWKQATWWLKSYLSVAVIVLMFITSMGIFGFLSKAHIEQTASANEGVAQLERIEAEIARNEQVIARAEGKIQSLEQDGTGASNQLQAQIDREQTRIDGAYTRIQPAIDEQNTIIANVTQLFQQELTRIDEELATLQSYIDAGEIRKAQGMVGTATDGSYGPKTAAAFTAWQDAKRTERGEWLEKIQNAANSPTVIQARTAIANLRANADEQIAESNALINNLREQLKSNNGNDLQTMLDEQQERVRTASSEIDALVDEKFTLESEYRKLEAEVGPVKYIAEFIYGETADNNILEEAVRWVIVIIIFVFDPLAVLLLIAAQYTFEFNRKRKDDDGERLRQEYEQARAQAIVDNPGVTFDDPVPAGDVDPDPTVVAEEENVDVTAEEEGSEDNTEANDTRTDIVGENTRDSQRVSAEETANSAQSKENVDGGMDIHESAAVSTRTGDSGRNATDGMALAKQGLTNDSDTTNETDNTTEHEPVGEVLPEEPASGSDETDLRVEQTQVQPDGLTTEQVADSYIDSKKKTPIESLEESNREAEYNEKEKNEHFQINKTEWKKNNPSSTLKHYKNLYIKGVIEELPWERSSLTEVIEPEGYQQNAEQNESSLFNRIRRTEQD